MPTYDRRTILGGAAIAVSLGAIGGVAGVGAQDDDEEREDEDSAGEPEFDEWFEDVDEAVDETGEDEVEIAVGAGDDGRRFDPEAVRISEGTTVVWEWTDDGGSHDVVHDPDAEAEVLENGGDTDDDDDDDDNGVDEDDDLEPEFETDLSEEEGHTFEHEFDEAGTYLYVCTAHEPDGMRGMIIVDEDEDEDEDEDMNETEGEDEDETGDNDG
ncbi:plastocyanin/azurin family copper-binding protein [Natrialba sp. SSL1]|uniref:plastocyanin/azurin family copper-binding protein n=1 Tax=Natrialba sp. SSL1 TaxID=1869245 RepID=UPI0008F8F909|nr:plastocyanin/azurin family copper-binding protein [Natrialba sp. SSL1]OIB56390.1 halocyanin [Natrialba sp. SSL1]